MSRQIDERYHFCALLANLHPVEVAVLGTIDDLTDCIEALKCERM